MEIVLALGIGVLAGSGVWLLLRPRTYQVIIGLSLLSYAVNLFIFAMGRLRIDMPPVLMSASVGDAGHYTDPVPQALVLTAIVIGFAMTALFLAAAAASYGPGPLEDWTDGALTLDGKQRLVATQAAMSAAYAYEDKGRKTVSGAGLATPDIDKQDLFIEAYVKPSAGAAGTIAAKLGDGAGYRLALNRAGGATLTLVSASVTVQAASGARIADDARCLMLERIERIGVDADDFRVREQRIGPGREILQSGADRHHAIGFVRECIRCTGACDADGARVERMTPRQRTFAGLRFGDGDAVPLGERA